MKPLNVWLNNVSLQGMDGRILVQGVSDNPPQTEILYGDNPGRMGQRLLARRRVNRRVSVAFAIRELRDLAARAAILDRVNGWAQDGVLKVSNRPGQQLRVLCAGRATIMTPRDYTEEFRIDFDAAVCPFWEDTAPQTAALSGASGRFAIYNLGTADAEPTVTVTPTGGALSYFFINIGQTGNFPSFSLNDLNIPQGTALRIYYDDNGILRIMAGTDSLMSCRSEASADDLKAFPGQNYINFLANTACDVSVEVKSRWL